MGQAGREMAIKEFTLERMPHDTERVYRKVFTAPKRAAR
jgi:hypothetical protein